MQNRHPVEESATVYSARYYSATRQDGPARVR